MNNWKFNLIASLFSIVHLFIVCVITTVMLMFVFIRFYKNKKIRIFHLKMWNATQQRNATWICQYISSRLSNCKVNSCKSNRRNHSLYCLVGCLIYVLLLSWVLLLLLLFCCCCCYCFNSFAWNLSYANNTTAQKPLCIQTFCSKTLKCIAYNIGFVYLIKSQFPNNSGIETAWETEVENGSVCMCLCVYTHTR